MKKILLVEDDQDTRDIFSTTIKEAGFSVDTAVDGEDALIKATAGGYDLILLDVMLPKRDGLSVLSELNTHPATLPNKIIVMLSNLSQTKAMEEAKALGAADFINKLDFNPDQLITKIKSYFELKVG